MTPDTLRTLDREATPGRGKVQLLSDLREPPVVGRFYMVPVVRFIWCGVEADWPVLGPMHSDREFFNFERRHYHVEARFVGARLAARAARDTSGGVADAAQRFPLSRRNDRDAPELPDGRPPLKRMKCQATAFPYLHGHQIAVIDLRSHYGEPAEPIRRPDGRLLCPHRKVDLSQFVPDDSGIVTCPLHGLRVRCLPHPPAGEGGRG
jgi:hypothetical protein